MKHLLILLDTIQKKTHKYKEWGWKKNGMGRGAEAYLESSGTFTMELWLGSNDYSNERNKSFSF